LNVKVRSFGGPDVRVSEKETQMLPGGGVVVSTMGGGGVQHAPPVAFCRMHGAAPQTVGSVCPGVQATLGKAQLAVELGLVAVELGLVAAELGLVAAELGLVAAELGLVATRCSSPTVGDDDPPQAEIVTAPSTISALEAILVLTVFRSMEGPFVIVSLFLEP